MSELRMTELSQIDGLIGGCLVDVSSGMVLGQITINNKLDIEVAAAGNTAVVIAKRKTIKSLGLENDIEDILISLSDQYHIIRPLQGNPDLFLYIAMERDKANLAMARHKLRGFEKSLDFN